MLTIDDLRWAADQAEHERLHTCDDTWRSELAARAARFRAAAEAMEREGKRDD